LDSDRSKVEAKLRTVEERLSQELRARGFDPAQANNIAIPGPLAKLYLEREELRAKLETLSDNDDANNQEGRR
jgi:hypothetical protein